MSARRAMPGGTTVTTGVLLAALAGVALAPASAIAQMQAEVRGGLTVGSHSGSGAPAWTSPPRCPLTWW